uniref:ATP synthase F0 subunit 8 n=1 Tax=Eupelmus sp. ZJUH_2016012 TaxID=2491156 RepID=A0A3S8V0J8_9HYME|nr:ATP synthase F0 subunit 8 [Eupelmus sp. ZJUH_2016012]
MPQMSPLLWMNLNILIIVFLLLIMVNVNTLKFNYFIKKLKMVKNKLIFKWLW